jgi:hypothetical protein
VRKLLLVGRHAQLFQTVGEAFAAAIPGDTIEIRGNGPFLETAAEREFKEYQPGAPITLRAGKGFQPVVQMGHTEGAVYCMRNADLAVSEVHLTSQAGGTWFQIHEGQVSLADCTVTAIPVEGLWPGCLVCRVITTSRLARPRRVSFERCFSRNGSNLAAITGPDVAVGITDRVVQGGMGVVSFTANENHSVKILRSTFLGSYVMQCTQDGQGWPAERMRFRMQQSIFGHIACCPHLVRLTLPASVTIRSTEQAHAAFQLAFQEIAAESCVATYWEGWGSIDHGPAQFWLRDAGFAVIPPHDQALRFSEPIEEARTLTHVKGDQLSAGKVTSALRPADFEVASSGPLADLRSAGVQCGCDVSRLPVPPDATLLSYVVPAPKKV